MKIKKISGKLLQITGFKFSSKYVQDLGVEESMLALKRHRIGAVLFIIRFLFIVRICSLYRGHRDALQGHFPAAQKNDCTKCLEFSETYTKLTGKKNERKIS